MIPLVISCFGMAEIGKMNVQHRTINIEHRMGKAEETIELISGAK